MSEEEASASESGSGEEEEVAASQDAPEEPPQEEVVIKIPDGFTEIPNSAGSLDVSKVRARTAPLILFKLPPDFDVKALHGKTIRMKKAVDAAGAVGTAELDGGNFSLIASPVDEFARCVNAFPAGSDELASDGGGARDKPRPQPPLKLRWRPPGATVAPPTPPLPESIKRKQKRLSVHFDAAAKPQSNTPKRANDAAAAGTPEKAKRAKEGSSPEASLAEKKQKKEKKDKAAASPPGEAKEAKKEKETKNKTPPAEPDEAAVPASKKKRSKEKE